MYTPQIADRVNRLPKQFFVQLICRNETLRAAGHDVINLGQGNPDLPTPPHIVEALSRAARDPATHRYSPFRGLPALREAVAGFYERRFGVRLDPAREVAVLIGSKVGLVEICLALLNREDLCLMPDPGYPDYWSGVAFAGARYATFPLLAENGFLPDYSSIPADVASQAKFIFLNYPNNPTSAGANPDFFKQTVEFANRHGILVAHDLAYGEIVYGEPGPISFLQAPGAKEIGVEFYSLSKTYNMAGWRLGFMVGNRDVVEAVNLIQDHFHCSQFAAVQWAGIEALNGPQDCVTQLVATYRDRRDAFVGACREIGWPVLPCQGSFFAWTRVPEGLTSMQFADLLLDEAHVVVAPGIGFGAAGEGYARISLTAPKERLIEAVHRVKKLEIF